MPQEVGSPLGFCLEGTLHGLMSIYIRVSDVVYGQGVLTYQRETIKSANVDFEEAEL